MRVYRSTKENDREKEKARCGYREKRRRKGRVMVAHALTFRIDPMSRQHLVAPHVPR